MTELEMRIDNLERHVKRLEELANITDRLFMGEEAERREKEIIKALGK